jgi:hypothetical protein
MSGPALPGRTVVMCQQPAANVVTADCNPVDSTKTSADGRFTLSATPVANSWYSVVLPSSPDLLGNRSIAFFTGVTPQTDLRAPSTLALRAAARTLTNTMTTSSSAGEPTGSVCRSGSTHAACTPSESSSRRTPATWTGTAAS